MKERASSFNRIFLYKPLCFILLIVVVHTCLLIQPVLAERMAISSTKANVRSGPGTSYEVLWQVERYYPIDVIRKVGAWYFFKDFEGDTGWIKNTLIDKKQTVITAKGDKVNVRSGPGIQFEKTFMVERGVPFKVLKQKGKWLNIEHADGDQGWIFKALVW